MSINSYYYLGLSIISLLLLIFICYRKGTIQSLILSLILVQLAYLGETVIYIFFGSYQYYPKLIKYNSYYDSNMGAITSNLLAVPVLAAFIAAFELNWIWILFFTGLLAGIEWLFVSLHIYELHWWKIEYTSLGLVFAFFPLANIAYHQISHKLKGLIHSLFLFLAISPILGTSHIIPIMWFSNRSYIPGWFSDYAQDTTAFASIYYLCESFLIVLIVKLRLNYKWLKYLILAIVLTTLNIALKKTKILNSFVWWDPYYYILLPLIILRIAEAIGNKLTNGLVFKKA